MTQDPEREDFPARLPRAARPLARLAAGAAGLFLILFGMACSNKPAGRQVEASANGKPLPVQVAKVELRQVRRTVESVGSLFPYEEVTVSSEVEGKVEEVVADVGDRVNQGQPLVKILPTELRLSLDQQRAAFEQARARLGLPDGEEDLKDVKDAAEVKKAAADLNDADVKYRRARSLLDKGLLPRETFDETESRFKAVRAAYDLSIQAVQNLRAQLAQYRASMTLAQKKLSDSIVRAPFAGQVRERTVSPGQYLRVQTPLMVIVNVDPVRVRLQVPEKMAGWIQSGQRVTISVEAYPEKSFTGKIWRINPSVDQQTRSYDVEALIANRDGLLKPGFFVKANIPSEKVESALFVPRKGLRYSYGVYKVFVVEGNTLHEREVRIGERPKDDVEIVDGLTEGLGVALPVNGSELRDRALIEVVP